MYAATSIAIKQGLTYWAELCFDGDVTARVLGVSRLARMESVGRHPLAVDLVRNNNRTIAK